MELMRVTTPRGTRYFVDGVRVSRRAYESVRFGRSLEAFSTTTVGDQTRHVCYARVGGGL